jgi:hypothetical protein
MTNCHQKVRGGLNRLWGVEEQGDAVGHTLHRAAGGEHPPPRPRLARGRRRRAGVDARCPASAMRAGAEGVVAVSGEVAQVRCPGLGP